MKKSIIIIIFSLILSTSINTSLFAQKTNKIDLNLLRKQTQKLSNNVDNKIQMVWWIPIEYWETILRDDDSMDEKQIEEFTAMLSDYEIVAVLDGDMSLFGSVSYKPKNKIENNLSIITQNNTSYTPLPDDKINMETKLILSIIQPIIINMLGGMGENLHFFSFPAKNDKKQRILDPLSYSDFVIKLFDVEYKFKLPLSALLPKKKCPVDGELMNGAWKYCPWHGKKLKEIE